MHTRQNWIRRFTLFIADGNSWLGDLRLPGDAGYVSLRPNDDAKPEDAVETLGFADPPEPEEHLNQAFCKTISA